MSDLETARQLEQAAASHDGIPAELSFERVVKNQTSPVSAMQCLVVIVLNANQKVS